MTSSSPESPPTLQAGVEAELRAINDVSATLMNLEESARARVLQSVSALFLRGKQPPAHLADGIGNSIPAPLAKRRKKAKAAKTGAKSAKRIPTVIDKDFLKRIDESTPSFSDFLDSLSLEDSVSATDFVLYSVYFICDVLNEEKASLSQIATCFKADPRGTMPDAFQQVVRLTASRSRYIHYSSQDDITPASRGRKMAKDKLSGSIGKID